MQQKQEIEDVRREIDEVDRQLVALLNKRTALAGQLGRVKYSLGLEAHVPGREAEVLERVARLNTGPMTADALQCVYECIIKHSRMLQERTIAALRSGNPQ